MSLLMAVEVDGLIRATNMCYVIVDLIRVWVGLSNFSLYLAFGMKGLISLDTIFTNSHNMSSRVDATRFDHIRVNSFQHAM